MISNSVVAQYTVTKVNGSVLKQPPGESIKPGSKLTDEDILVFNSKSDMVRVIVAGKGMYTISPSPKAQSKENAIVELLKTALQIKSKDLYLSGRSHENEILPAALEVDEAVNSYTHFSTENKYLFNTSEFEVTDGSQFFIQVEHPGTKPFVRPLKVIKDTLVISSSDFVFVDADSINQSKYTIGHYLKSTNSSRALAEIKPYFDSNEEMATTIKLLIENNKDMNKTDLIRIAYAEIYESLGKPSRINFKNIFDKIYLQSSSNR
jgi:hypothetical protein